MAIQKTRKIRIRVSPKVIKALCQFMAEKGRANAGEILTAHLPELESAGFTTRKRINSLLKVCRDLGIVRLIKN